MEPNAQHDPPLHTHTDYLRRCTRIGQGTARSSIRPASRVARPRPRGFGHGCAPTASTSNPPQTQQDLDTTPPHDPSAPRPRQGTHSSPLTHAVGRRERLQGARGVSTAPAFSTQHPPPSSPLCSDAPAPKSAAPEVDRAVCRPAGAAGGEAPRLRQAVAQKPQRQPVQTPTSSLPCRTHHRIIRTYAARRRPKASSLRAPCAHDCCERGAGGGSLGTTA